MKRDTAAIRHPRRQVRLRCGLSTPGAALVGFTTNLSESGLHVQVGSAHALTLKAGERVPVALHLAEKSEPVALVTEVMWTVEADLDAWNQPVVGFGLRIIDPDPHARAALGAFIRDFRHSILCVDDEPDNLATIARVLRREYHVLTATSALAALDVLAAQSVTVVLTDLRMPQMDGLELLERISTLAPRSRMKRIVMSAYDVSNAQKLINEGHVFHFLPKPFQPDDLLQVVRRAVEDHALRVENDRLNIELERANARLRRENTHLRQRLSGLAGFEDIVGSSAELRASLAELGRVRRSDVTVHIAGETGTGKELVARALHFGGPRAAKPFLAQNCAGIVDSLLQSTLFGHQKGAYTGADRDRPGLFREADGGTLFLDEVAELSMATQGALLRALQEKEVTPLGASRAVKTDVRIISATHKDLREAVRLGLFREDLYFRLVVISVRLPALRERTGDVPLLARHFLDRMCERHDKEVTSISVETMQALEQYPWPGNVRELENELERAVVLTEPGATITPALLSPHVRSPIATPRGAARRSTAAADVVVPRGRSFDDTVTALERALLERALGEANGVVARAAVALGMERTRFSKMWRRLRENGAREP